jgi:hypothetical protein
VSSEELGAWRCVQASVVFAIHDAGRSDEAALADWFRLHIKT